jgi:hypothetical protein
MVFYRNFALLMPPLPPELLRAVVQRGAIALVLGAGCSLEPPTNLPLSNVLSRDVHARLVADHVLTATEPAAPTDLSAVADAVFAKTGSQAPLVNRLPLRLLKNAKPNMGYLLAAALMREEVITHIVTLNFDHAINHALATVNASDVAIIGDRHQHGQMTTLNVIYLHGNVDSDADEWVLRSDVLKGSAAWINLMVPRAFSGPVTIFAGLGAPARVFLESVEKVAQLIKQISEVRLYQVGPGHYGSSAFTRLLGVTPAEYIQRGWCDFMIALADHLVSEHLRQLSLSADSVAHQNGWPRENLGGILQRLRRFSLLELGFMRGSWFLEIESYLPWRGLLIEWMADLLLILGLIERCGDLEAWVRDDGAIELRKDGATVGVVAIAHGRGRERYFAIEGWLYESRRRSNQPDRFPHVVLISGMVGSPERNPSPPLDIARGNRGHGDLLEEDVLELLMVDEIRGNPAQLLEQILA